ncbi:unnamed protein product [Zymoseptoria tritici ST99CH_1A5]|uniref:Uncharacterized protein n=1 Tax=Zymoseptoria tritici ST99CH_1A5 TaxID=1276529 RepID=A0A1Y6LIZ4_ZYMTR|nr:unnamed protein product [Zymoseptoria tritici ST99CH_1A5]
MFRNYWYPHYDPPELCSRNKKAKVYVEVDEAFTVTEASLLIVFTKGNWVGRIVIFSLYGDIKQLKITALSAVHSSDGNSPAFNEFGPQYRFGLFARLIRAGLKRWDPEFQSRMHPACFKLPNIWFYGGSVSSLPPNHASFELPAAYVAGLCELRHLGPNDKALTETQKRMPLITLKGDSCVKAKMVSSKGNFLTASYIFNTIIPMLKNIKKMVTLITPYKMQHTLYKSMMFKECMANGRTDDEYPRLAAKLPSSSSIWSFTDSLLATSIS